LFATHLKKKRRTRLVRWGVGSNITNCGKVFKAKGPAGTSIRGENLFAGDVVHKPPWETKSNRLERRRYAYTEFGSLTQKDKSRVTLRGIRVTGNVTGRRRLKLARGKTVRGEVGFFFPIKKNRNCHTNSINKKRRASVVHIRFPGVGTPPGPTKKAGPVGGEFNVDTW